MSWSLGEVRALAVKAARGAGLPWGLAEEAGFAVEWLEQNGAPGVESLAGYLDLCANPDGYVAQVCPLAIGANISDTGKWKEFFPLTLYQPLLVTPFLSLVTKEQVLKLSWQGYDALVSADAVRVSATHTDIAKGLFECTITKENSAFDGAPKHNRVPDSRGTQIDVLSCFASKTYAPSTEASRNKGAGAGLSDND